MDGGIYLWKDGRETPDTVSVSSAAARGDPDQLGFRLRQQPARRERGRAGHARNHFARRAGALRSAKDRTGRRAARWPAAPRTRRTPTCRISSIASARARSRTALSISAFAFRWRAAWLSTATAWAARCAGMRRGKRSSRLAGLPAMDFGFSDDQRQLRKTIREFTEAEIKPHVMEWDESQHFPAGRLPQAGRAGRAGRGVSRRSWAAPATATSITPS